MQHLERTPTTDHEVLGDYLEPVHSRVRFENVPVMGSAQTHAEAKKRKLSPTHWCGSEWPGKRVALVQVRSRVELLLHDVPAFFRAFVSARSHYIAFSLAGVLALAAITRTFACTLAFATVPADAFHLRLAMSLRAFLGG